MGDGACWEGVGLYQAGPIAKLKKQKKSGTIRRSPSRPHPDAPRGIVPKRSGVGDPLCSGLCLTGGGGGGEGSWTQKFVYQKWPDQIFFLVNFVLSRDGHFGLWGGSSLREKNLKTPARLCSSRACFHTAFTSRGIVRRAGGKAQFRGGAGGGVRIMFMPHQRSGHTIPYHTTPSQRHDVHRLAARRLGTWQLCLPGAASTPQSPTLVRNKTLDASLGSGPMPCPHYDGVHVQSAIVGMWHGHSCVPLGYPHSGGGGGGFAPLFDDS